MRSLFWRHEAPSAAAADDNENNGRSPDDDLEHNGHRDNPFQHMAPAPPPPELGEPLLPLPVARSITLGTDAVLGAVRTARSVGRIPFHVARYTTSASIELSRYAFETVLGQSGRGLYAQYASGPLGGSLGGLSYSDEERARVASVVANTFDTAHRGFHYLQLFTAAGFEMTGASVATLIDMAEVLLLSVDGVLGSTESSRALRSIVAFMSREFRNPATGLPGERVGLRDLMWGLCGHIYLQSACRKLDEKEWSRLAVETVVWDVVVLDGRRVDVHENSLYGRHRGAYKNWSKGDEDEDEDDEDAMDLDLDEPAQGSQDLDLPERQIRRQISSAVPADARVVVSTSTAKIITVDVTGSQPPLPISPPPGVELIELGPLGSSTAATGHTTTTYRIVFRINTGDLATTSLLPERETGTAAGSRLVEQVDDDDDGDDDDLDNSDVDTVNGDNASTHPVTSPASPRPPPLPPKPSSYQPGHAEARQKQSQAATRLSQPPRSRASTASAGHRTPGGSAHSSPAVSRAPSRTTSKTDLSLHQLHARANQKRVRLPASRKSLDSPHEPRTEPGTAASSSTALGIMGVGGPPRRGSDTVVLAKSHAARAADKAIAATTTTTTTFRSVLKKPNLSGILHKEPPSTAPAAAAPKASVQQQTAANKKQKTEDGPSVPPPMRNSSGRILTVPTLSKKHKAASGAAGNGSAATASKNAAAAALSPSSTQPPTVVTGPFPPALPARGSPVASSGQLSFTPLTERALHRHDAPFGVTDDSRSSSVAGIGGSDTPASYMAHRKRRSLIPDDLESLASIVSLASSMADNISIQATTTTTTAVDPRFPHHPDDADGHLALPSPSAGVGPGIGHRHHRSRATNRSSIYTLRTNDSQNSLVLSSFGNNRRNPYDGSVLGNGIKGNVAGAHASAAGVHSAAAGASSGMDALDELRRTGFIPGMFPNQPLLHNLRRYMRFSSAAYGRDFLRALGISQYFATSATAGVLHGETATAPPPHREIASYAHHTGVSPDDIVLASFIDVAGGPDSAGRPTMPLVHYITLDHASRAVVLACRGTLGFEDILADMACAYDDLFWRGRTYQVHKGIHASARRLLYGGDGRVLATLRDALLRYPDYGLVLCGHSLGGAVTALLGVMLSQPRQTATLAGVPAPASSSATFETAQMTPRLLMSGDVGREIPSLPPGRPVHVFAYGPPGTMSPGLRKATRGLITTVVQGNDLVPYMSLGVLHDLQAIALAFKTDDSQASAELWGRLWETFRSILARKWYGGGGSGFGSAPESKMDPDQIDDAWAYSALKTLRASMLSAKLLPPGEVLVVETQPVLQRVAYGSSRRGSMSAMGGGGGGKLPPKSAAGRAAAGSLTVSPARRVVLKYVGDVEARFREIRFAFAAPGDHNPSRYERALDKLEAGVQF